MADVLKNGTRGCILEKSRSAKVCRIVWDFRLQEYYTGLRWILGGFEGSS